MNINPLYYEAAVCFGIRFALFVVGWGLFEFTRGTKSKAWLEEYGQSDDPMKILFSSVYSYHDPTGVFVAEPFLELPPKKVVSLAYPCTTRFNVTMNAKDMHMACCIKAYPCSSHVSLGELVINPHHTSIHYRRGDDPALNSLKPE